MNELTELKELLKQYSHVFRSGTVVDKSTHIEHISQQWLNVPAMVKSIIVHYYNVARLESSTYNGLVNQ